MKRIYEWWSCYQRQIIVIGSCIIGTFILLWFGIWKICVQKDNQIEKAKDLEVVEVKKEESVINEDTVKVDIKGAVNNPGVYTISSKSRVVDAITISGGLNENADTSVTNLSRKVFDEMVIVIYTKDEVSRFIKVKEEEQQKQEACIIVEEKIVNDACVCSDDIGKNETVVQQNTIEGNNNESSDDSSKQISINVATLEELMTLSGIGESKAKEIIEYREVNNGFQSLDELKNIKGIGDSVFEKIKDRLTL